MTTVQDCVPEWHLDTPCTRMTDLFFSERKEDIDHAKLICRACPNLIDCRKEADMLETSANSVFGVRGGMDATERRNKRRRRPQGGARRQTA